MTTDVGVPPPIEALRDLPRAWILGLLVVVLGVYVPSIANDFALDDPLVARAIRTDGTTNSMVGELRGLADYFTSHYWAGSADFDSRLYRPITILSYAITNAVTGDAAWSHHLLNVLLHAWATLLVLQMILVLVPRRGAAMLGALAFGLHPIHSEVVAGIVGRAELFAFCFGAQALLLSCRVGSPLRSIASGLLLFLALCSKESAIAWVPFAAIYALASDFTANSTIRWKRAGFALVISAAPLIAYLILRQLAVGDHEDSVHYLANPLHSADTRTRILTGVMIWGYGLWKCLVPIGLVHNYGPVTFELVESMTDGRFIVALTTLCAWLFVGLRFARRQPALFAGMACFLGFSFVTSNVPFAIGTLFGERLYYTPSFGIALLVAWVAMARPNRVALAALILWLLAACVLIVDRNVAWADDTSLILHDAPANPRCVDLLDKHARLLRDAGDGDGAELLWRRAVSFDPLYPNALTNLATYLAVTNRHVEAEEYFRRALAIPDSRRPMRHLTRRDLSVLYEQMGRTKDSLEQLRLAWREPNAYSDLLPEVVERTLARLPAAESERIISTGERRRPGLPTWRYARACLAHHRGDFPTAERIFEELLAEHPRHVRARFGLAVTLFKQDRRSEARPYLESLRDDPYALVAVRDQARRMLQ
jgi:protein O-mannosyl-transferase